MSNKLKILGMAGSLREESYNRALLREAQNMVPEEAEIEIFELHDIPGFNQDKEDDPPQKIKDLKQKASDADAILFVTPEYNYSISGVLKNAIDWASRPYGDNSFAGKPAGIMGATISMLGTSRAQYHLRQMCVFLDIYPINQPEVMVSNAAEAFDDDLNLTDETSKDLMREHLQNLVEWTKKINS